MPSGSAGVRGQVSRPGRSSRQTGLRRFGGSDIQVLPWHRRPSSRRHCSSERVAGRRREGKEASQIKKMQRESGTHKDRVDAGKQQGKRRGDDQNRTRCIVHATRQPGWPGEKQRGKKHQERRQRQTDLAETVQIPAALPRTVDGSMVATQRADAQNAKQQSRRQRRPAEDSFGSHLVVSEKTLTSRLTPLHSVTASDRCSLERAVTGMGPLARRQQRRVHVVSLQLSGSAGDDESKILGALAMLEL